MTTRAIVNHLGHCVSDIARARQFYVEVLGFEPWFDIAPPDQPSDRLLGMRAPLGMECSYLRRGDLVLELLHFNDVEIVDAPPRVMNNTGFTHLSFAVDDLQAACARVQEHGGTVLVDTDIGAAVFIRDPDGQLIELLPMTYRDNLPPAH
jgi:catechol 2,3-dioxygenase-like lactoylglutathione lyase family enzyme